MAKQKSASKSKKSSTAQNGTTKRVRKSVKSLSTNQGNASSKRSAKSTLSKKTKRPSKKSTAIPGLLPLGAGSARPASKKGPAKKSIAMKVRPLPGSRVVDGMAIAAAAAPVMQHYVVNLKEKGIGSVPLTRGEAVNTGTSTANKFLAQATKLLEKQNLLSEVRGFGEAFGVPIVTFTGTPAVAELFGKMDGVLSVYRDEG